VTPNYSQQARELVLDVINAEVDADQQVTLDDVFVVWFCKTLKNWKALVSTTQPHAWYYELTHNGETGETYIDCYTKVTQIISETISGKAPA
jgi:hypothetical protein